MKKPDLRNILFSNKIEKYQTFNLKKKILQLIHLFRSKMIQTQTKIGFYNTIIQLNQRNFRAFKQGQNSNNCANCYKFIKSNYYSLKFQLQMILERNQLNLSNNRTHVEDR